MKVVGMDGSIHSFKIVFLAAVLAANKVLFCWEFNWSEESSKRRNSKGSCGISKCRISERTLLTKVQKGTTVGHSQNMSK